MNDLLEIYIEGPMLKKFSADSAVKMWLNESTLIMRSQQSARKHYKPREQIAGSSSNVDIESDEEDNDTFTLDEWDQWLYIQVMTLHLK